MGAEYVLASGNRGKLRELMSMLQPLGFVVRPQSDWRVPEAEETACTFVENSLLKARQAAQYTGLPAIADDSGLVVPALNGAPGIYSSRYAGEDGNDQANMRKLITELSGKTGIGRRAYFYCAIVLISSVGDPAPLVATGRWHGYILDSPQGNGGFGYDPLFGVTGVSSSARPFSAAELSAEDKSRVSHRGQALKDLIKQINDRDVSLTG